MKSLIFTVLVYNFPHAWQTIYKTVLIKNLLFNVAETFYFCFLLNMLIIFIHELLSEWQKNNISS